MSVKQYCISWDSFKSNISKGFSSLQQNAEFVDMTLAAEGYFVKVHQNIIALASPYLKQILQSVPSQHPIIFLSNISNTILGYLLEYVYTGEVKVPIDAVNAFIQACKALQITGVENFIIPKVSENLNEPVCNIPAQPSDTNYAACITINAEDFNLEVNPIENNIVHDNLPLVTLDNDGIDMNIQGCATSDSNYEINSNDDIDINIGNVPFNIVSNTVMKNLTRVPNISKTVNTSIPSVQMEDTSRKDAVLYSVSNRGSVQLILNRYIYYCHHHSSEGRKRRWRCIDYRKIQCPATVDTYEGNITDRNEVHSHRCHSNKIFKKVKQKSVFNSMSCVAEKIVDLNMEKNLSLYEEKFVNQNRIE